MSDEVKKISFGFSKLAKPKTSILSNNKNVKSDDSVQFIDCVEDKSIKVKDEPLKKPDFLVIPLPKQTVVDGKRRELLQKILNNTADSDGKDDQCDTSPVNNVSTLTESTKVETLDEIAAREIVEDLKKVKNSEDDKQNFTVPLNAETLSGGKEATLDDYESIPVDKFGLAMLRGMGWAPGKGIGKTEQLISAKQPLLRPKGLGLGADKVIKTDVKSTKVDELLKLIKGSFVRIIAGVHQNLFGEVIGFDDETGRLIVKMALGNNVLTFNEFMVEVISKEDFNKNSKVINVKKYEEYKMKESSQGVIAPDPISKQTDDYHKLSHKTKHKHDNRRSSESSIDLSDEKKSVTRKSDTKGQLSSPERNKKENLKSKEKTRKIKHESSPDTSPERSSSKYKYSQEVPKKDSTRKSRGSSSPEYKRNKYYSHSSHKEYSKKKKYRSSSEESSTAHKHVSRKESTKRRKSSSSESSSPERHSKEKKSKSNNKNRRRSSSLDSTSDENSKKKHRSDYKKKCKKNKEKKKSKRRSRSYSGERNRKGKVPKKHKKSKYYE